MRNVISALLNIFKTFLKYAELFANKLTQKMSILGQLPRDSSSHQYISHNASVFELENPCITKVINRGEEALKDVFGVKYINFL